MARLTVIVPVYNAEPFLRTSVDSIINQTFKDLQIILIDDGSTDNSGEIIEEYAYNNENIFAIHQKNQGSLMTRFKGVINSDTEYISFVDADDWIDPNTYQSFGMYMANGVDMISYQIYRYFSEKEIRESYIVHPEGMYDEERIHTEVYPAMVWDTENRCFGLDPSLCNKIIKRDYLNKAYLEILNNRFEFTIGEDCAVTWPIIKKIKTLYISDKYFYYHRQRSDLGLAPYIRDSHYNRRLSDLYEYLAEVFERENNLVRQLDYFLAEYTNHRLKVYGDDLFCKKYLFPYKLVHEGEKVILYGAGVVGVSYYKQIKETGYCTLSLWVDAKKRECLGENIMPPTAILNVFDYDTVVIALADKEKVKEVLSMLAEYGVDKKRIKWKVTEI